MTSDRAGDGSSGCSCLRAPRSALRPSGWRPGGLSGRGRWAERRWCSPRLLRWLPVWRPSSRWHFAVSGSQAIGRSPGTSKSSIPPSRIAWSPPSRSRATIARTRACVVRCSPIRPAPSIACRSTTSSRASVCSAPRCSPRLASQARSSPCCSGSNRDARRCASRRSTRCRDGWPCTWRPAMSG